jgi:multidrug resistance protein
MIEDRTRRPLILGCIILSMFMVAIEATVIATAMPSIVAQLGGFSLYSWVFTAFLLTQAGTTVIFGKLADIYGRKPVMVGGLVIFAVGSVLCGFAWSIGSLIAFRLLQGLGAGCILPVAITLVGDLYTTRERASVQGWLSSVWAVSAILGPLLGGFIVQALSWPWVFWINIPFAVLTIAGLALFLHERPAEREEALDIAGAGIFLVAIAALLLALTLAGTHQAGWALAAGLVFLACIPLFLWQERRAAQPMVDLALWTRPVVASTNSVTFAAGMAFMGVTTLLPIYAQGVLGASPTQAGVAIGAMSIGWPGASVLSRCFYAWIGVAWTSRLAGLLLVVGCTGLIFLRPQDGMAPAAAAAFLIGAGMGFLTNVGTILIQSSVDWSERGAATSSNTFARNLGNMLGAALLGGVLNGALALYARQAGQDLGRVQHLLEGAGGAASSQPLALRQVLGLGVQTTFVGVAVVALLVLLLAWRLPTAAMEAELGKG